MTEQNKKIRNLNKAEMLEFFEEHAAKITEMHRECANIRKMLAAVREEKLDEKLHAMHNQASEFLGKIQVMHGEIFQGDEESQPLHDDMTEYMDELKKNAEEIRKEKNRLLGYSVRTTDGRVIKQPGEVDKMLKSLSECDVKYTELRKKTQELRDGVENELRSGVTTIQLSKAFREKAVEYTKIRGLLEAGMFTLFLAGIGVSIYLYKSVPEWNVDLFLSSLLPHVFVASIFTWMMIFLGNRRAENKKLEEVYKHKEALAKSYVGYERSIAALGRGGSNLMVQLMERLLVAIEKDPSDFLSVKGEKHPVTEMLPNPGAKQPRSKTDDA